tara:strand:- start:221 stop:589 length:369 start_codon:yes stop_codon:yes gene_type:complete
MNRYKPKKKSPTVITTRYTTACPHCGGQIAPGQSSKVYANKWYHLGCWDVKWSKVIKDKESKKKFDNAVKSAVGKAEGLLKSLTKAITNAKINGKTFKEIQLLQQELDNVIEFSNHNKKANK